MGTSLCGHRPSAQSPCATTNLCPRRKISISAKRLFANLSQGDGYGGNDAEIASLLEIKCHDAARGNRIGKRA